eukprot:scaffold427_cov263-Pinguiococcus_pyrenoidosus.AAC.6
MLRGFPQALLGACPGQVLSTVIENPEDAFPDGAMPDIPRSFVHEVRSYNWLVRWKSISFSCWSCSQVRPQREGAWNTTLRIFNVTSAEDYQIFEHIGNRSLTHIQAMLEDGRGGPKRLAGTTDPVPLMCAHHHSSPGVNAIDDFGYTPLMLALTEERSQFHTTLFGLLLNLRSQEG